jgi:hypothetical protein
MPSAFDAFLPLVRTISASAIGVIQDRRTGRRARPRWTASPKSLPRYP